MAAGGVAAAGLLAFIIPLWGLNFLWAGKVYKSALKMAGILPSRKRAEAER